MIIMIKIIIMTIIKIKINVFQAIDILSRILLPLLDRIRKA